MKAFRLFLIFFVGVAAVGVAAVALIDLTGHRQDEIARSAAENSTFSFRKQFKAGEPLASVEESLALRHANMLHRGNDILVIAKEGRSIWYCNHNYFGTSLRFAKGKLRQVETDEWLGTCL